MLVFFVLFNVFLLFFYYGMFIFFKFFIFCGFFVLVCRFVVCVCLVRVLPSVGCRLLRSCSIDRFVF